MAEHVITFHRQTLYEQVWTEPLRVLAKRYGVSDVTLAGVCGELRVPRPSPGAWERARAGKKLQRRPLPPLEPGQSDTFERRRFVPEPPDPRLQDALERERSGEAVIQVEDELLKPHSLVARAGKILRKSKAIHGLLYGESEPCLDIVVSQPQLGRALRVMDALVRAFEARGFVVAVITNPPPGPYEFSMRRVEPRRAFYTQVTIEGIALPFGLEEETKWVSKDEGKGVPAPTWAAGFSANTVTRVGTGVLELNVNARRSGYWRTHWRDGRRKRLEGILNSFVVGLIEIAHDLRLQAEEEQRERDAEVKRRRLAEEAKQRAAEQAEMVKFLEGQLHDRRVAREIREYVAEIKAVLDDAGVGHIERSELAEHLRWASEHADGLDPVTRARRSIREGMAELRARAGAASAPEVP